MRWPALICGLTLSLLARGQASDSAAPFGPPIGDERLQTHASLQELEGRFGEGAPALRWDGEAWLGTDTDRLWLKSEGFAAHGALSDSDAELLFARPITPYFDLQSGVRYDLSSSSGRGWAALGLEGLAPGLLQLTATVYVSDGGHDAARLDVSHDELLTQRLILEPRIELNAYTRADAALGVDAGVSDIEAGLRLRYEVTRKFAPYIGVAYQRLRGLAPDPGRPRASPVGAPSEWTAVLGVRGWL